MGTRCCKLDRNLRNVVIDDGRQHRNHVVNAAMIWRHVVEISNKRITHCCCYKSMFMNYQEHECRICYCCHSPSFIFEYRPSAKVPAIKVNVQYKKAISKYVINEATLGATQTHQPVVAATLQICSICILLCALLQWFQCSATAVEYRMSATITMHQPCCRYGCFCLFYVGVIVPPHCQYSDHAHEIVMNNIGHASSIANLNNVSRICVQ